MGYAETWGPVEVQILAGTCHERQRATAAAEKDDDEEEDDMAAGAAAGFLGA